MKPQPRYKPGDKIGGRYQVHKALMGGMGEVYLCLDLEQNYPSALKTFQQRYLTNLKLRKTFKNEVATWIALGNHPNIVRCYYLETIENQPFMFLEWIVGEEGRGNDLRAWLRHGPLDLRLALNFTVDICRGLTHAQQKQPGIVHRDLKPDNILIAQGPLGKITDFGLAKIVHETDLEIMDTKYETNRRQSLLGKDGIVGTPPYMAPEQWRNEELDQRTDIYAIGCILYEMLTGKQPFEGQTHNSLCHQHLKADIPKLTKNKITLPALDIMLSRCLAKRKEERFVTIGDFLQELEKIYQDQFSEAPMKMADYEKFTALDFNNRGMTYNNLRHYNQALVEFEEAIKLDNTFPGIYVCRSVSYANLNRYDEALSDLNHAIEMDRNLSMAYTNRGNIYANLERYNQALADYNHAIQIERDSATAYLNRGRTYESLKRYDEALADYDHAIKLDPSDVSVYNNRGNVYNELKYYNKALIDFDYAIQLDPIFAPAYNGRGTSYASLGQYNQALTDYSRAIELDSTNKGPYINRADLYYRLRCYENALSDYSRAIQLDPNYAKAYSNRGVTYEALGKYDEALRDHDMAIKLDPAYIPAYTNRGHTYEILGRYKDALQDYTQAIELDNKDITAHFNIGVLYSSEGMLKKALPYFERAAQLGDQESAQYAIQIKRLLGL